jgi:hypothetical protein
MYILLSSMQSDGVSYALRAYEYFSSTRNCKLDLTCLSWQQSSYNQVRDNLRLVSSLQKLQQF